MSYVIIDRRLNEPGKNLPNSNRYLKRVRSLLVKSITDSSQSRSIQDVTNDEQITLPSNTVTEPSFHKIPAENQYLLNGNTIFIVGDNVFLSKQDCCNQATNAVDDTIISVTPEEYLEILFDGLELPNLDAKKIGSKIVTETYYKGGFNNEGSPANLSVQRTFKKSLSRRIALKRPSNDEIEQLNKQLENPDLEEGERKALQEKLDALLKRRTSVPFLEKMDLQYHTFNKRSVPKEKAVVFCIMDVSGSMNRSMRATARQFFQLLYWFVTRQYSISDIVFIAFAGDAVEQTEEEFFNTDRTGGTVVASGIQLMLDIVKERYSDGWNIYSSIASDGEDYDLLSTNTDDINEKCVLIEQMIQTCQHTTYLEVSDEHINTTNETSIMRYFNLFKTNYGNIVETARAHDKASVVQVFRNIFSVNQRK